MVGANCSTPEPSTSKELFEALPRHQNRATCLFLIGKKSDLFLVEPIWQVYQQPKYDLRPVYRKLSEALDALGIDYQLLSREDCPLDIWIRDWGFVEGAYFRFAPSYANHVYPESSIERARQILSERANCTPKSIPLVLDGGNLIHNGKIAIMTEKALWDNAELPRGEIEGMITSLGFERLVFIPVEPEDVIGHADGILRFLSPSRLLVNDYHGTYFADYRQKLLTCLERANLDAEPISFPWFTTDRKIKGIWSAEGCYINFILTAHGIVCPRFNHPRDSDAVELLVKHSSLPVRTIDATALARLGGVLNCAVLTL